MGTAAAFPGLGNDSPFAEAFNFKGGNGGESFILQRKAKGKQPAGAGTAPAAGLEGAGGAVSSCHCHMLPTSPFLWNSWRWSAYLGRGQSHVSEFSASPKALSSSSLLPLAAQQIPKGHSSRINTVLCSRHGQQGTGITAWV